MEAQDDAIVLDMDGNFDTPTLRAIHKAWDALDEGSIAVEEVDTLLQHIQSVISEQADEVRKSLAEQIDLESDQRIQTLLSGFDQQLRGLEYMSEFLETEELARLDHGLYLFQMGSNRSIEAFRQLSDWAQPTQTLCCLHCSEPGEIGESHCQACGASLPKMAPTAALDCQVSQSRNEFTTEEYFSVSEGFERLRTGEYSEWEFLNILTKNRSSLEEQMELNLAQEEPNTMLSYVLTRSTQALDHMTDSLLAGRDHDLELGLDELAAATLQLLALDQPPSIATAGLEQPSESQIVVVA